jgi:hypothetical protein
MSSKVIISVAITAATLFFSSSFAQAAGCSGPGWVKVSPDCPLPNNLGVGDGIEITVGSAVFAHGTVVAVGSCYGETRYFTSDDKSDCGFRRTVTAYRRTTNTTENAFEALKPQ